MGWEHTAREDRRAPVGEYKPERVSVVVYDTFEQRRLRAAALLIRNGMSIPEFFLYCADYVTAHHRQLAPVRKAYRKAARRIVVAGRTREAMDRHLDDAWHAVFDVLRAREAAAG